MCRLYGMVATHPTRAECELVDAQNSMIRQAVQDGRGLENPHGWGIGKVIEGRTECTRQVEPADQSQEFRSQALDSAADLLIAHVRRATVGDPSYENTHPFRRNGTFMAHNGHIGAFDEVRERIREQLSTEARKEILGDTDSEHFFQLALGHRADGLSTTEAIQRAAEQVQAWTSELDGETDYFLNTLWGERGQLAGTKKERSLWYIEREEPVDCDICERPHARPGGGERYRSIVIASERITDEAGWEKVPSPSVFHVTDSYELETAPLFD